MKNRNRDRWEDDIIESRIDSQVWMREVERVDKGQKDMTAGGRA